MTALVAATSLAGIAAVSVITPLAVTFYELPLVTAFALALVHAVALPLVLIRPNTAVALSLGSSFLLQILSAPSATAVWPWWAVLIVTETLVLFLLAVRATWQTATTAWLVATTVPAILGALLRPERVDPTSINLVVFASVSGGIVVVGIVLAQWNGIRSQLLRERSISVEEHSRRMLAEDRARIAREVHDVIAHGLSIINVQSTTAVYRNPEIGTAAQKEFAEIAASSRQALGEMRGLLGILRDDGPTTTQPAPNLAGIPDLVAQASRAGTDVRLSADPDLLSSTMSDVVGLVAYRIVQEALSNAIRHAAGSSVSVSLERTGDDLIVTVENGQGRTTPGSAGSGFGLTGMKERATSVSGTVDAESRPDGGFVVRAILPVPHRTVTG